MFKNQFTAIVVLICMLTFIVVGVMTLIRIESVPIIVGTWQDVLTPNNKGNTIIFKEDGTWTDIGKDKVNEGVWICEESEDGIFRVIMAFDDKGITYRLNLAFKELDDFIVGELAVTSPEDYVMDPDLKIKQFCWKRK